MVHKILKLNKIIFRTNTYMIIQKRCKKFTRKSVKQGLGLTTDLLK